MEKKSIILELPCELIDRIDTQNAIGNRSEFITRLLEEQLQQKDDTGTDTSTELTTKMSETENLVGISPGVLVLIDSKGVSLGKFDINTVEGFEDLAKKIQELSEDPIVRMRASGWL
jgi:hypothetical protein